ncbi:hypothetical protein [uncultured Halomonas sp.]|uniref:hypothetical protein n=1 Tax=uncultured Halomonas sp. TaxID=173971 RepID=UPI002602C248|nr:hypothetical protein [uncultured Halomonas sp.]
MAYHDPIHATYTLAAADLTSTGTLLSVVGPAGKRGRLVGITGVVTTGVTVAASTVTVGTAGDGDAYGTLTVPIASAGAVANDPTVTAVDDNLMPADTAVVIATGGEATAGAADLAVHIAWY